MKYKLNVEFIIDNDNEVDYVLTTETISNALEEFGYSTEPIIPQKDNGVIGIFIKRKVDYFNHD